MGFIRKFDARLLGYDFLSPELLPEGKDEHYIRFTQNPRNGERKLTGQEVDMLVRNGNMSDNWDTVWVNDPFNPGLVRNCIFYGLVRIGKLEPQCLEYHDLRLPVGLYNSMIISSDIGNNVAIHNVGYLSHFIIDDESIFFNIQEMETSNKAKFGNGILKEGEIEDQRIWMEIANENGGRKILPFNGILTSDAFLWSKYRDDSKLMDQLKKMTDRQFSSERGYYGHVGRGCVIKSTSSIKDVNIGDCTYIKGANKLKNLTINSSEATPTQIGEGVELVNGIVGYGCKAFYGVKAVRFIMGDNSSLKYGARLINSFLGENSTISCCEVLNSLIYPSHEQHHNNSFLIAATIQGQSNIAAGATIGSNHTSRANDGEVIAQRGFWAGLSTSIKHNSKFAAFTLLTKANYLHSINITYPFALVGNNESTNRLEIVPAYWWRHNMYAIERNSWKFGKRDTRKNKPQRFEFYYLAPDSVGEILLAITQLKEVIGSQFKGEHQGSLVDVANEMIADGYNPNSILVPSIGIEASQRDVLIHKPVESIKAYEEMVKYYSISTFMEYAQKRNVQLNEVLTLDSEHIDKTWLNLGGQIVKSSFVAELKEKIKSGEMSTWDAIHREYKTQESNYRTDKAAYAKLAIEQVYGQPLTLDLLQKLADESVAIFDLVKERIYTTRMKDYTDPFRKMAYNTEQEMAAVVGQIDDNEFIEYSAQMHKERLELLKTLFRK